MAHNLRESIIRLSRHSFSRYLIIAGVIVVIEVASFQIIYLLGVNYLLATVLSMGIGIVLNWIASRLFVFQKSSRRAHIEFSLVLVASLVGVIFQTFTTYVVVAFLHQIPVIGKVVAIGVTFFWNYFIRALFIYK